MKIKSVLLSIVLICSSKAFSAECKAWIQQAILPAVPNIQVQLQKRFEGPHIEHYSAGDDPILKVNNLRVFIDLNAANGLIEILLGQRNGNASSFKGILSREGNFRFSYSFDRKKEIVIQCEQ